MRQREGVVHVALVSCWTTNECDYEMDEYEMRSHEDVRR